MIPSIQNREIKKQKMSKQKRIEIKQELNSNVFIHKHLISNNQTSQHHKQKKYPKSPYLQKKQKYTNQEIHTLNLDNQREQEITKQGTLHPIKHKKGKSMDFQIMGLLSQEGYNSQINPINTKANQKVIIHMFYLDQFRARNTISEMRNYRPSKKLMEADQKKTQIGINHKKHKSQFDKNTKKLKKHIIKLSDYELQQKNLKKHQKSCGIVSKHSKVLASTNSCSFPNRQSKSMEFIAQQRSKSSRQKNIRKTPNIMKKLEQSFPFPSKLNSLYSNTSSLFSSKKQFERFQQLNFYKIPTEIQEQFEQIRKYESNIIIREDNCNNKRRASDNSLVEQLYDNRFNSQLKTQQIITNYLNIFQNNLQNQQQTSLVIQSGENLSFYNRTLQDFQQRKNQRLIKSHEFINEPQIRQQQNKLNEVIQIIEETDTLGAEKKETLLKKIRQIIPIGTIGSKQMQKQMEEHQYQNNKQEKLITPNLSLKSSFLLENDLQLINIKIIDQTLYEREIQLQEKMKQEMQSLQKNAMMTKQQIQTERGKIVKWITLQINQIQQTRAQLNKGLNFAKTILKQQKMDQLKNVEPIKCSSDKGLATDKFNQSHILFKQLKQGKDKIINEQKQIQSQSQNILPKQLCQIQDQENPNDKIQQNILQHKNEIYTNHQLLRSIAIIDQNIEKKSTNILKNHIFIDSAQKVEYQFDESHSSIDSIQTKSLTKNLLCQMSSDFLESQLKEQDKQINIFDIQQFQQYTPTIQTIWLKLTPEQKQDIFQFILFDLSVELYEDQQIPRYIFYTVHDFIQKQKERKKQLLGFKTNSIAIKKYIEQIITYINNHNEQLAQIHSLMDRPIGPTNLQILRYMHPSLDKQSTSVVSQLQTLSILESSLFDRFQQFYLNSLQFEKVQINQIKEKRRITFLKSAIHIHNKAIFDCLNEQLDKVRPFGQWGEPFKWKSVAKFHHPLAFEQKNKMIITIASNVSIFGQYLCGFIKDKQQCAYKDNPNITSGQIEAIRGQRLIRLLSDYLQETQKKLIFIDDQETELLITIDQLIFEELLIQLTQEIFF